MNKLTTYLFALLIGFASLFVAPIASAALPAVATTTFDAIETDGLALIDLVWPVLGSIVGGFILIKLFKRGAAKI
jgi:hypothetical protein